jgi:hypothetical protein
VPLLFSTDKYPDLKTTEYAKLNFKQKTNYANETNLTIQEF